MPKTNGILESSLYVSDVPRSVRFYQETLGFRVIKEFGERGCAMRSGERQVLLLFKKGAGNRIASRRRITRRVCYCGRITSISRQAGGVRFRAQSPRRPRSFLLSMSDAPQ